MSATVYALRRLFMMLPTILIVIVLVFSMLHFIPGDPAVHIAGEEASAETIQQVRSELGLDRPVTEQLRIYVTGVFTGDWGVSFRARRPVLDEILPRFANTLYLAAATMVLSSVVGLFLGILAAVGRGTVLDQGSMLLALAGLSIPNFWLGLLLILGFSYQLRWFPMAGSGTLAHLVLPAVTLGTFAAAEIARMTRSSMLDVISAQYVTTAKAKGLAKRVVVLKHAFRNALIPVITLIGLRFGYLLGGAIVTENVFAWPGLGRFVVQAIHVRDLPTVQGAILIFALSFALINILVDVLYMAIDPRIRY